METISEAKNSPGMGGISPNDSQTGEKLLKQIFDGSWMTQAIWVAAALGIADILEDGPCSVESLADKTGTHSNALYRVLRALASVGIFVQEQDGRFSLTPSAGLLRSNIPGSQRSFGRTAALGQNGRTRMAEEIWNARFPVYGAASGSAQHL